MILIKESELLTKVEEKFSRCDKTKLCELAEVLWDGSWELIKNGDEIMFAFSPGFKYDGTFGDDLEYKMGNFNI